MTDAEPPTTDPGDAAQAYCAASRDERNGGDRQNHEAGRDVGDEPDDRNILRPSTRDNYPNALQSTTPAVDGDDRTKMMVRLEGGPFIMGTDSSVGFPQDGEGPAREVTVDPFYVDKYAVTNIEFLEFVRDTGYTNEETIRESRSSRCDKSSMTPSIRSVTQ